MIDLVMSHMLANQLHRHLEFCRGQMRRAQIHTLGCGQQFNRQNVGHVVGDIAQLARGEGRHRHMIFLVGAGRQAVHTGRMRIGFIFAGQRGGGDMGNHEPGIDAAVAHQKRRQARQRGVDQQRDTALGQRADFGSRDRQIVGGEGHRLGMKVAARQHFMGIRKHQRIVGDGIGFAQQHQAGVTHLIETGAHHLRLAAQAVGVLHLVAMGVAGIDGGTFKQHAIGGRGVDLPRMAAQALNARIEWRHRAFRRVHAERAGDQRGLVQILDSEHVHQRNRGRGLGAVQQRESFLGRQDHRLQTDARQALVSRQRPAIDHHLTHAQQHRRHMRQRRQIARCADRTLGRDARQHIGVEQFKQGLDHDQANARVTAPHAGNF